MTGPGGTGSAPAKPSRSPGPRRSVLGPGRSPRGGVCLRHSEPAPISRAGLAGPRRSAVRRPARAPVARTGSLRPGKSSAGSRGEAAGEAASAAELDALELTKLVGAEPAAAPDPPGVAGAESDCRSSSLSRGAAAGAARKTAGATPAPADSAKGAAPQAPSRRLATASGVTAGPGPTHGPTGPGRPTQRPQAAHKARATGKGWRAAGQGRVTLRAQARVLSGRPQT
jgi:hypothetical protein